jgi:long-chain fatty acid transport protein
MRITKIAALTALALLPGASFATVGYFSHGYGMKSTGMGGVGIALPQDAIAAASNPAGMVLVGDRYDVGLTLFRPDREATITGSAGGAVDGTYDANGKSNFFIPEFGFNKMMNPDLALGVSVYGNGGMNTTYDNGIPLFGTGPAGVDLSQLFIAPTLSAKLDRTHSIGLSLNLAYQRFKAEGLQNFGVNNPGYDTSTGWGIRLGWTGQVLTGLTLGATWQSKTNMSKFDKYKGLFAEQGDFDIPENFGFGVAFQATPALTIAADVMKIKYSGVPAIANASLPNLGNGLGSDNGPGFGWDDMTVYKIGANYALNPGLTLRGGFATGKQPINSSDAMFNMLAPGVVENHLTLGATWTLADKSEVSVGYMHAFSKTVTGSNAIPLGGGFPGGDVSLKMQQNSFGIGYGRRL